MVHKIRLLSCLVGRQQLQIENHRFEHWIMIEKKIMIDGKVKFKNQNKDFPLKPSDFRRTKIKVIF